MRRGVDPPVVLLWTEMPQAQEHGAAPNHAERLARVEESQSETREGLRRLEAAIVRMDAKIDRKLDRLFHVLLALVLAIAGAALAALFRLVGR